MKKKKKCNKDRLKEGHVYYISLFDTYSQGSNGWKTEEDFVEFVDYKMTIEVVGWYYKSNEDFHYFYSVRDKDAKNVGMEIGGVNHTCFLFAVPKKAVIEIVELGKKGKKK